jgi:O-antigen/teichoic acid export membrane protein
MKLGDVFLKNILSQILGKILDVIISLLTIAVLARYLKVEEFGIYSFVFAYIALFLPLADLGMTPILTRELSKDEILGSYFVGNATILRIFLVIFTLALIYVFSFLYKDKQPYIMLSSMFLLLYPLSTVNSIFQSQLRVWYLNFFTIFKKALFFINCYIVSKLKFSLVYIFGGYSLAEIVTIISLYFCARRFIKPVYKIDFEKIKFVLKESIPLFLVIIMGMIYTKIDTMMLMYLKTEKDVGLYNGALQLYNFLLFFPATISFIVFPVFSKLSKHTENFIKIIRFVLSTVFFLGVVITSLCFVFGKIAVLMLLSEKYLFSLSIFYILILEVPFLFTTIIYGNILTSLSQQKDMVYVSIISCIINILLNFVLIPRYSSKGAAIATVSTQVSVFLIYNFVIQKQTSFNFLKYLFSNNLWKYWGKDCQLFLEEEI